MTELELMANEEARHGNREALERLEAELRGAYLSEMVALGQAQEAYEAQKKAEAKLAKAVEALTKAAEYHEDERTWWDIDRSKDIRTTLAELKGDTE